jgi:antitoxin component of RelBE/YafQ-DinJ toxin-antitoxin module
MSYGGTSMPSLTIRIPDELKNELLKVCSEDGISASDMVRDSLKKTLAVHEFRKLRRRTLPFTEAQGLLTDEDIFNL